MNSLPSQENKMFNTKGLIWRERRMGPLSNQNLHVMFSLFPFVVQRIKSDRVVWNFQPPLHTARPVQARKNKNIGTFSGHAGTHTRSVRPLVTATHLRQSFQPCWTYMKLFSISLKLQEKK